MPTINLDDLNIRCERDVPLGPLTWYGVGGPARVLAHPDSLEQLTALAQRCQQDGVSVYVLGAGANLLVSDAGVDGVVVRLDAPAFRQLDIHKNIIRVGAGYDLARLVRETARQGLAGLECMAGIPASVGGAVRMNAGGTYGDIGKSILCVHVMDAAGQPYRRDRDDMVFAYRKSNIVARFITHVELELAEDDPELLSRRVKEIFAYKSSVQPLGDHSAGCAFKNPAAPGTPSAGKLIDQAGLKGFAVGGASVSDKHANFIVTRPGDTTAADVLAVMAHVQQVVADRFGVRLEREVVVWP